jgi:crotonobetainyl-CoA:carnitine CoA-transferase CaiB-like acyl-CoA transferase
VKNRPALKVEIERAFAGYTVDTLVARLMDFGVPCGRVRTVSQALADPQVEPRQMFIPFDDPELGTFRVLGNPIKLSETPADLSRRPPKLGEHTEEVLGELHQTSTK